jgi:hypothetical protein
MSESFLENNGRHAKQSRQRWRGILVGASLGGVARPSVAALNIYVLSHWGGPWFASASDTGFIVVVAVMAAVVGAVAGGAGGATGKPLWGTVLGAVVSGGCYIGLCVLPTELSLAMNASQQGGNWTWERGERLQIVIGVIPMMAAGAIAGAVGAMAGNRKAGASQ